jgi:hypothetical protein
VDVFGRGRTTLVGLSESESHEHFPVVSLAERSIFFSLSISKRQRVRNAGGSMSFTSLGLKSEQS